MDAVEESICFGWIDSKVKELDEDGFIQWYAPRQPNSAWSLLNKKKGHEDDQTGEDDYFL